MFPIVSIGIGRPHSTGMSHKEVNNKPRMRLNTGSPSTLEKDEVNNVESVQAYLSSPVFSIRVPDAAMVGIL